MRRPHVRLAREDDAPGMLDIYAPIVRETAISFELEPPVASELRDRIRQVVCWAPWLVAVGDDGAIAGYTYASRFRQRPAYQWTVEVTIFVAEWARAGITAGTHNAFYCGTGWRGSEAFFNAWLLGWPRGAVYVGGWFVWSNVESNPTETGVPEGFSR